MPDLITLPADTAWLDGGKLGVAIVRGETVRDDWSDGRKVRSLVAPRQWAQYDNPCQSCGGGIYVCSHCRDGRQVWTVRWPRPRSDLDDQHLAGAIAVIDEFIHYRATIQVVPVTLRPNSVSDDDLPAVWVHPTEGWVKVVIDATTVHHPSLDPLPTPGRDFAVIVRLA